jgi:hypothetical protein
MMESMNKGDVTSVRRRGDLGALLLDGGLEGNGLGYEDLTERRSPAVPALDGPSSEDAQVCPDPRDCPSPGTAPEPASR